MIRLTKELLEAFGVAERPQLAIGDTFYIRRPHVCFYGNRDHERPAVVTRVQLASNGDAAIVHLYDTTTTGRPPPGHRIDLHRGEGGVHDDCRLDLWHPPLSIRAADLIADCDPLGRLSSDRIAEIEMMLQASSRVPPRVKRLPR
jgi:hypothetical protein